MKIKAKKHESPFRPIDFVITIESQEELNAWTRFLNIAAIGDFFRANGSNIEYPYSILEDAGGSTRGSDELGRKLLKDLKCSYG